MTEIWYRPDGSGPISVGQFIAEGHKFGAEHPVARWEEEVEGQIVTVSTVFLGLDHNFGFGLRAEPLIYETMVFGGDFNNSQRRYPSAEQAQRGHDEMVSIIQIAADYDMEAPTS